MNAVNVVLTVCYIPNTQLTPLYVLSSYTASTFEMGIFRFINILSAKRLRYNATVTRQSWKEKRRIPWLELMCDLLAKTMAAFNHE